MARPRRGRWIAASCSASTAPWCRYECWGMRGRRARRGLPSAAQGTIRECCAMRRYQRMFRCELQPLSSFWWSPWDPAAVPEVALPCIGGAKFATKAPPENIHFQTSSRPLKRYSCTANLPRSQQQVGPAHMSSNCPDATPVPASEQASAKLWQGLGPCAINPGGANQPLL
jgi:hypothetical protein